MDKPLKQLTFINFIAIFGLLFAQVYVSAQPQAPEKNLFISQPHQLPFRSSRNQVYQFMTKGEGTVVGYLWIPETCKKVRGLLIFAQNVPESLIAGHPSIRKVCTNNDLAILYCSSSFWPGKVSSFGDYGLIQEEGTKQLLSLISDLATKSGYPEISTVPWLPIGESMSLLMVRGILNEKPERCIAGIYVSDISYGKDRTVPILGLQGTAIEWWQAESDIRSNWRDTGEYQRVCDLRKEFPQWPATLYVEAGGGHFNCSEDMLQYMVGYIDCVVKARLTEDGSLKPIDITKGFLAHLPLPGKDGPEVESALGAQETARPWYFDRASAEKAQFIANVNWNAATQVPSVIAGDHCVVKPWAQNSVTTVEVATSSDFSLQPILLDEIQAGFVASGQPLAKSPHQPIVQWLSGPVAPLGDNRFCIELDRNYKNGLASAFTCLEVIAEGTGNIRYSVQPLILKLIENTKGSPQTISFQKIDDAYSDVVSIPLKATSSAGLQVKYYVESGPAIVENNRLVFTKLPPNAKFPVEVTVVAWQWGTCELPLFTKAISRQTFKILK